MWVILNPFSGLVKGHSGPFMRGQFWVMSGFQGSSFETQILSVFWGEF